MTGSSGRYTVVRSRATAAEFHARAVPEPARPEIWIHDITGPALVLGSAQRDEVVDRRACRRAGVEVVRRRSGGGAVYLAPGDVTWFDVIVPAGAAGWADDVHVPMAWLGEALAGAFAEVGLTVEVHRGKMVTTEWSRLVCFDGLGAGEVTVDGAKLVGISQRRTRHAARLQCCWYHRYDPADLLGLLAAPGATVSTTSLRPVATVAPELGDRALAHLAATLPA